jgi:large subunit ribosomal protein L9
MAKTEIILTSNILGLGAESDQVKVAAGYARNYLFPRGLAIPLTGANKRRLEVLRQRRAEREAHEFNTMNDLAKSISKLTLLLKVKSGEDGKMFGAVTSGTVADELKHQFDIGLDKRKIHLEHPIRILGDHEIELRLHQEIHATLKVHIESTTPLPEPPPPPATPEGKDKEGREWRRGDRRGPRRAEAAAAPAAEGEAPKAEKSERPPRAERPREKKAPAK